MSRLYQINHTGHLCVKMHSTDTGVKLKIQFIRNTSLDKELLFENLEKVGFYPLGTVGTSLFFL